MDEKILVFILLSCVFCSGQVINRAREFIVDYENDQFLMDGEPFKYVSGSLHYYRVARASWRDRLRKLRAAGLNAVSTYVEWSLHEPSPGLYDFSGELDLLHFIQLAQEEDLYVILRPGPYICAERDFGGLPAWLLSLSPSMHLRSYDSDYRNHVQQWLNVLMPKVNESLYSNGGPVILVQVENEYGSFDACDFSYTRWLRDLFSAHVGDAAVLFTTDGNADSYLKCGKIQDVLATIDFGPGTNVTSSFAALRNHEPRGPLINSEFYPGWLTHWEEDWQRVATQDIVKTLDEMLSANISVNFYVFAGGTNFAFTSGANYGNKYQPSVTSYDYDAPLTEAGDTTEKYIAIRNVIGKYFVLPDMGIPDVDPKGDYGNVDVGFVARVFDPQVRLMLGRPVVNATNPLTFEELGQRYGFVLYEADVPDFATDPALLSVPGIADRAIVSVDDVPKGVLSRARSISDIPLIAREGQVIQLFVENQGRINYGGNSLLRDFKGIIGKVLLSEKSLEGWRMTGFPLDDISWIQDQPSNLTSISLPGFFRGEFTLPPSEIPLDTYLDMTGYGKGVVFINGNNLGRYWPKAGPITTLYVPASTLLVAPATNHIVVFEMESITLPLKVQFTTEHNILTSRTKKFKFM